MNTPSALLHVARREVAERKMVFAAGLVLSILPLVTPLLPGVHGDAGEIRQAVALMSTCALSWGAALVLGATVWVRDLAEGKLGFYFSRPLSPAALFGGKLLGAFALVYGASAIVLLPTALLGGMARRLLAGGEGSLLWLLVLAVPLFLLPVASAVNLAIRSRDAWLALDLCGAAAGALLLLAADRTLSSAGLNGLLGPFAETAFLLVLPAAALAAGFAQAARGRTDIRRAHRVLSAVGWSIVLPFCAAMAGGAYWFVHPSIRSLKEIAGVSATPNGDWLLVAGTMRLRFDVPFGFLADARRPERHLAIGIRNLPWAERLEISADGTRAAWLALPEDAPRKIGGRPREMELVTALLGPEPRIVPTTIRAGGAARLALSGDGRRLAIADEGSLSVLDLPSGWTLAAARIPERGDFRPAFLDDAHVRLTATWGGFTRAPEKRTLPIHEFDVGARRLERTGALDVPPTRWLRAGGTRDRLIVLVRDGPALLCDARTGAALATLLEAGTHVPTAAFLSDGRIVVAERSDAAYTLVLFGHDGARERSIPLPPGKHLSLGGQPAPDRLVVALVPPGAEGLSWSSLLLDLASGRVLRELPDLSPAAAVPFWTPGGRLASGEAASLFVERGAIVRVDPATGARTRVLP